MRKREILERDIKRFEHEYKVKPCAELKEKIQYYKKTLFNHIQNGNINILQRDRI